MPNFYPGPSKVYPQIADFMQEAYQSGILSINHRSDAFMEICRQTMASLHEKLNIPTDYQIVFTSSATECWEIIAQSLIQSNSLHFYNGDFGKKWAEYTQKLCPKAQITTQAFDYNSSINLSQMPDNESLKCELCCITHNETSNGTAISAAQMLEIRQKFPQSLIAYDVTSSLGGVMLDYSLGDIWFASVQKCLGLPAGLAVLILSPQAVKKAYQINERAHYNSLAFILDNFAKYQTPYTPNVLGIYLLWRVMQIVPNIHQVAETIVQRAKLYENLFSTSSPLQLLVKDYALKSYTVITISASSEVINEVKEKALKQNIILGNGYGAWKNTSFRVANFPAILEDEIEQLQDFFKKILHFI
jgi:phosphoserine aminotransferase